jgi:protein phosphatase
MKCFGKTDIGAKRKNNQDSFATVNKSDYTLAVVCDGMGGARGGNIASGTAVKAFCASVREGFSGGIPTDEQGVETLLTQAVNDANTEVYRKATEDSDLEGMGTTLVAALISGKNATIVNVGDSRCYHITHSDIRRITVDHSLVQMMVDRGEIAPEEARDYPGRNYITRAVGTEPTVESDVFAIRLERGDAMLLSSDGLHNEVDDQEILFEVVHGVNNDNCCKRLFDIADKRGSPDNVTCVLVMV